MEYVYFIKNENNNLIKIGRTANLERRIKELKSSFTHVGDKSNLLLLDYIETEDSMFEERQCHKHFNEFRETGEWFNITIDMIERYKSERKEKQNEMNEDKVLIPYWYGNEFSLGDKMTTSIIWINTYAVYSDNKFIFTLEDLIVGLGFKPTKGKGKSIEQFQQVLEELENMKTIEFIKGSSSSKGNNMIRIIYHPKYEKGKQSYNFSSIPRSKVEEVFDKCNRKEIINCLLILTLICKYKKSNKIINLSFNQVSLYLKGIMTESSWITYTNLMDEKGIITKVHNKKKDGANQPCSYSLN